MKNYTKQPGVSGKGSRRDHAEYVMAVYQGIVREVYRIEKWRPAGTLPYKTRDAEGFKKSGRWEFEGVIATEVRDEYIGNSNKDLVGESHPLQKHMKSANMGLYRPPTSSADKL